MSGTSSRIGGEVPRAHVRSALLLWIVLAAALIFLVVNPLFRLVQLSLQDTDTGAFTLLNYVTAYSRPRYLVATWNSLQLGFWVTVLCLIFAVPIAWAVSRTDMPCKGAIRLLVLGAFVTPPYLGSIGWILLAGPNSGWLNRVWMALTGAQEGLVQYLFVRRGWRSTSRSTRSRICSSSRRPRSTWCRRRWRMPRISSAPARCAQRCASLCRWCCRRSSAGAIVTFLEAIALFGTPALIAIPARFNVVTTQLLQFFSQPIRAEVAAAYAVPLLLITVVLFGVQRWLIRRRGFVALTGKGGERRQMMLGPWRWVMLGYALLLLSLSVLLPYTALAQAALSKAWGRGFSLDNLTLQNFHYLLFQHDTAAQSVINSFTYAAAAACIAIGSGVVDRLYRQPPAAALGGRVELRCDGAVRGARNRAGDRVLCRLCAAAAGAVWHGADPDSGLRHALPADRLCQCRCGDPQHQSGDGGCGAHPGRWPAAGDPIACWRR